MKPRNGHLLWDYLLEVLEYNKKTGVFRWTALAHPRVAGQVAGNVNSKNGYRYIQVAGQRYLAGRLAHFYVTGYWPSGHIDHKNRLRDDNRWTNLRDATRVQNLGNMRRKKNNKSGYKGVVFIADKNKYRAVMSVNYKNQFLGYFDTAEDAHAAYCAAAKKRFGEFAHEG